jgi:hypothetical protein
MKIPAILAISIFLFGCSGTPDNGDENLTTELDGSKIVIKRKGVQIAQILNHDDGFSVQVSGGDDEVDMNLHYYEDESSTLAPMPEVVSRRITKDGQEWLITYDDKGMVASKGKLLEPNTVHKQQE